MIKHTTRTEASERGTDPGVMVYDALAAVVRNRSTYPCTLREHSENTVQCQWPESILQSLWNDQRIKKTFTTEDGRHLRVVHPGIWNLAAGPDFRRAIVEIDGKHLKGDVEIHRRPQHWYHHRHHEDPAYDNVVLHVVLDKDSRNDPPRADLNPLPPCLVLRPHLNADILEVIESMASEPHPYASKLRPGGCSVHLAALTDGQARTLLRRAGLNRFHGKVRDCLQLLLATGTEQSAYWLLMDALGYRANREPFRRLAEQCRLAELKQARTPLDRCACLFGSAGLLKDPTRIIKTKGAAEKSMLGNLWDRWWRQGQPPIDAEWKTAGVRPANRPAVRLLAGWQLLEAWGFRPFHTWWEAAVLAIDPADLIHRLRDSFQVEQSDEHDGVASAVLGRKSATARKKSVVGRSRVLDLLCNAVLPLLCAQARQQSATGVEKRVEAAYLALPKLQMNRTFREMGHRLLMPPGRLRILQKGAAEQQGLISVYRDFCEPQGGDCSQCPLSHAKHIEKLASQH